jgi:hypothetical protein
LGIIAFLDVLHDGSLFSSGNAHTKAQVFCPPLFSPVIVTDAEAEFDKCPFCDRSFDRDQRFEKFGLAAPMEEHVKKDHGKVRVTNGRSVKWVDAPREKKRPSHPSASRPND